MAVRDFGVVPQINSEGKLTNPTTTTVLADTGQLIHANYEARLVVGASVAATFVLERRNAANTANVGNVPVVYTPAGQSGEYVFTYRLETNERLRCLPEANITGTAAATLQIERML